MSQKAALGRPLKFRTSLQLERKVNAYFEQAEGKPTYTGLADFLGVTRKQLIEYGEREDFRNVINGARTKIQAKVEELLVYSKQSPAGLIFWLKNSGSGWSDAQQIDINDISGLSKDQLIGKLQQLSTAGISKKAV